MYKSGILVTSHLNNKHKIDVAKKQINQLKQYSNLPIIHASNYQVDSELQKLFDYTIIKKNEQSNRYSMAWNSINIPEKYENYRLIKLSHDYGYSHIDLMLFGFKFCKSIGLEYIYHINYDCIFEETHFNTFIQNGIKRNPNFYRYNLKNNNIKITTQVFSINVDDFINAVEKKIHFYKDGVESTSFHLKKGWLCEEFFEWIFNSYYGIEVNVNFIEYDDIINTSWEENRFEVNNSEFRFYFDEYNNEIIFANFAHDFTENSFIITSESDTKIEVIRYKNNIFFSKLLSDGKYFIDEELKFEFNTNQLKKYYSKKY